MGCSLEHNFVTLNDGNSIPAVGTPACRRRGVLPQLYVVPRLWNTDQGADGRGTARPGDD
ncbi:MAG TPA: hypothetical protein VNW96_11905 [Mycobacterium sp.]|nr:hypothetical protein [Mycobacterium sp.]